MQIFTFRKGLTAIALSLLCCVAYAQKTVILETPGKLSEKISGAEKYTTTSLVISGPINGAYFSGRWPAETKKGARRRERCSVQIEVQRFSG